MLNFQTHFNLFGAVNKNKIFHFKSSDSIANTMFPVKKWEVELRISFSFSQINRLVSFANHWPFTKNTLRSFAVFQGVIGTLGKEMFEVGMSIFQSYYETKLKTSKFKIFILKPVKISWPDFNHKVYIS